jgi:hypothetical protein
MRGFIFLGDLINLEEPGDSIEIIDNYVLRRAKGKEIDHIKHQLNSLGNSDIMIARHEGAQQETELGHVVINYLERDYWNYWIIERDVPQGGRDFFDDAIALCSKDLNRLFDSIYYEDGKPSGSKFQHNIFYNFLEDVWMQNYIKSFSKTDAEEITELYELLADFKGKESNHLFIKKALDDFRMLKRVSRKTPFFFVSMFSIIESLITHNPTSESKSISHQLATKLFLLNKRFEQPMILDNFFKNPASFEKTIKLLYTYRSDIAHGNNVNFDKLQAIESKEKASDFLYQLLKNVIIQSLKEPDLITDLKSV